MSAAERPVVFECKGDRLLGVISLPDKPCSTGVVIVVGGPQYRAGSNRHFVAMARALADAGVAALRFDYRGMEDSDGHIREFGEIQSDVASAVHCLADEVPEIREVILWGLCDGASAALLSAHVDPRVRGLVMLNPWIRTDALQAVTLLRHYYL